MAARGIALREWALDARDFETEEAFRQAVVNELAQFEHMGHRLGVGLVACPVRQRVNDAWVTTGWVFRTETVPAVHEPEQRPERPGRLDETPDFPDEPVYTDVTTPDETGRD